MSGVLFGSTGGYKIHTSPVWWRCRCMWPAWAALAVWLVGIIGIVAMAVVG